MPEPSWRVMGKQGGPHMGSVSITWELGTNTDSQAPLILGIGDPVDGSPTMCVLNPRGDSLRTTVRREQK